MKTQRSQQRASTVPRAIIAVAVVAMAIVGWRQASSPQSARPRAEAPPQQGDDTMPERTEFATFAGGCFWCTEAVFEQTPGVLNVVSGYIGGETENPTYEQVSRGNTGHAEAIEIEYDPTKTSYETLLDLFWRAHDPTQLNRQGNDVGTQYRSAIFYHTTAQRQAAEASLEKLQTSGQYSGPIVTEIVPATPFYKAEDYHQDYYVNNKNQGYCQYVVRPKLKKLGLLH